MGKYYDSFNPDKQNPVEELKEKCKELEIQRECSRKHYLEEYTKCAQLQMSLSYANKAEAEANKIAERRTGLCVFLMLIIVILIFLMVAL